jgi:hypothetical protein
VEISKKSFKAKEVSNILNISVYAYIEKGILKPLYLPLVRESKAVKRNKRGLRFEPKD